jgi:hypothetical protein
VDSQRITADTDVGPVFGGLDDDARAVVLERLLLVDERLVELRDRLGDGWATEGVELQTLPSGQASVRGQVARDDGSLTFAAELRPGNYFSDVPWRPGEPPRSMETDAWDVDGVVYANVRRYLLNKKYWVQETVAESEARRFTSAADAAAGLLSAVAELTELALSRAPTVEAWAPDA